MLRMPLTPRVTLLQADLGALPGGPYDLVVANPPYIPEGELAGLAPEVRDFEPHLALNGGADGLDCYRRLLPAAAACLKPGGWLLLEVGCGQAPPVTELLRQNGYAETCAARDLAGIERVVGGRLA